MGLCIESLMSAGSAAVQVTIVLSAVYTDPEKNRCTKKHLIPAQFHPLQPV